MLSVKIENRRSGDHQIFEIDSFERIGPESDNPYGSGMYIMFPGGNGAHYPASPDAGNPTRDIYVMNSNGKTLAHYEL